MNEVTSGAQAPARPLIGDLDDLPSITLPPEHLDRQLIVGFNSYDNRSRPFNLLRTQIAKTAGQRNWRMLGMTSATPAAGKTFNSVNLAAAMSRMEGQRVMLCDFDLRRASILAMFDIAVPCALNDYLSGATDDLSEAVYRVNDGSLCILPTREVMRDSSESIASSRFLDLVSQLRALPDDFLVLCDLPPVFANDDAMLCVQQLDSYLLVVDHGHTTARQIEDAIRLLDPTPCLGTILNRYHGGFADDYGYGYGDSYGLKTYGREK